MAKSEFDYPVVHDSRVALAVDELHALKVQRDLAATMYDQKAAVLKAGFSEPTSGSTGRAQFYMTVSSAKPDVQVVDWEAVARKLNPSVQLITAHTKVVAGNPGGTKTLVVSALSAKVMAGRETAALVAQVA